MAVPNRWSVGNGKGFMANFWPKVQFFPELLKYVAALEPVKWHLVLRIISNAFSLLNISKIINLAKMADWLEGGKAILAF